MLLRTYLGAAPDEGQRARLYLMRQVNHLFYAMIFLNGVAEEQPGERLNGPQARSLAQVHQALATGDFVLESREGRIEYGLSRLDAALQGLRAPRCAQAMDLIEV